MRNDFVNTSCEIKSGMRLFVPRELPIETVIRSRGCAGAVEKVRGLVKEVITPL